jgi:hypothetical protein
MMVRLKRIGAPPVPRKRSAAGIVAKAAAATAATAVAGLAAYWLRERAQPTAEYQTIRQDGAFSIRRYAPMVTAATQADGVLTTALDAGFRRLFGYISGDRRAAGNGHEAIAMTTPVTAVAGEHPGSWTIRFVMPPGQFPSTLPAPGRDVTIEQRPGRLIAVVRFSGRESDATTTAERRDDLIAWVRAQGLTAVGEPEFADYNAPIIPGPVRRNEWWIEIKDTAVA